MLEDLDGDGDLDVLILQRDEERAGVPAMVAVANDGAGTFTPMSLHPLTDTTAVFTGVDAADMDSDGDADNLAWRAGGYGERFLIRYDHEEGFVRVAIAGNELPCVGDALMGFARGLHPPTFLVAGDEPNTIEVHTLPTGATVVDQRTAPVGPISSLRNLDEASLRLRCGRLDLDPAATITNESTSHHRCYAYAA